MSGNETEGAGTTYAFYPIVRPGLRPGIEDAFDPDAELEAAAVSAGELGISLAVAGGERTADVDLDVRLFGPGDVLGLDDRTILREEPTPRTTDHPPTQFPVVEFGPAELPWLFSPQRADEYGRTHPWLSLVAVDRDHPEVSYEAVGPASTAVLEAPASELPDPAESWAWAHAQRVGDLSEEDEADELEELGEPSPRTRSRLVCPRNLEANTRYRACVVPTFEAGRLVGLDRDPADADRAFAWGDEATVRLPAYHSWTFTCAEEGDFRRLANKLDPEPADDGIGTSYVDVTDPGPASLRRGYDPDAELGAVTVTGALRSVESTAVEYDAAGEAQLRTLLNREAAIDRRTDLGVVAPPLYGRWHAGVDRVSRGTAGDGALPVPRWFDALNAEPANRAASGLGTVIVNDLQEELMDEAWNQFDGLDAANDYLARAQLFRDVNGARYERVADLPDGELLGLAEAIYGHARLDGAGTLRDRIETDPSVRGRTRPSFRRLTRSNGALSRRPGVDVERAPVLEDRSGIGGDRFRAGWRPGSGNFWEGVHLDDPTANGTALADDPAFRRGGVREWTRFAEADLERRWADDRDGADRSGYATLAAVLAALDRIDAGVAAAGAWADDLERSIAAGDAADVDAARADAPAVLERLADAREDVTALERRLRKLLGESDAPVGGKLDEANARAACEKLRAAVAVVEEAVRGALERLDGGDSKGVRSALAKVRSAAAEVEKRLGALREALLGRSSDSAVPARSVRGRILAALERIERDARILDGTATDLTGAVAAGRKGRREVERRLRADPTPADRADAIFEAATTVHRLVQRAFDEGIDGSHPLFTEAVVTEEARRLQDEAERLIGSVVGMTRSVREPAAGEGVEEARATLAAVSRRVATIRSIVERLRELLGAVRDGEGGGHATFEGTVTETLEAAGESGVLSSRRVDPSEAADELRSQLDPEAAFADLAAGRLGVDREVLEGRTAAGVDVDPLDRVLAAPTFPRPMYEPLAEREPEWFLPGLEEVPRNCVVLLLTNRAFIEGYMAGLNHEFARELRWRKFPTDRRGTYFRRFWDRSANPSLDPDDPEDMADVAPMHLWGDDADLGENAPAGIDDGDTLVLLVRGELLERYPNTTVYATDAREASDVDEGESPGDEGEAGERVPALPDSEVGTDDADREDIKFPEFEGTIGSDVAFYGFDLTVEEALYDSHDPDEEGAGDRADAGWFFVFEEPAAEPRFGLLEAEDDSAELAPPGAYVEVVGNEPATVPEHVADGDEGRAADGVEETDWGRNAAHVAEYTWRQPYRVAMHASTMLPDDGGDR